METHIAILAGKGIHNLPHPIGFAALSGRIIVEWSSIILVSAELTEQ
jgi:hypothetical protein